MEELRYKKEEEAGRVKLKRGLPIVLRFDGKNVTKDHKGYPLMEKDGFTSHIFEAAKAMMEGIPSYIYAVLDEVSVVVLDSERFWERFDDTDLMYCLSIMLQEFLLAASPSCKGTFFGCTIFQIEEGSPEGYIEERHSLGLANAIVYCAKEYRLPVYEYHGRDLEDILFSLQKAGHGDVLERKDFFNGLFARLDG